MIFVNICQIAYPPIDGFDSQTQGHDLLQDPLGREVVPSMRAAFHHPYRHEVGGAFPGFFRTPRSRSSHGARTSCRNCGKTFAHSVSMLRHRRKCEGTPHLTCAVCGRQFCRRDSYSSHLAVAHGLADDKSRRL
ncbi:hypothetical protein ACOMHN_036014 [Nucella lapillus]